MAEFSDRKSVSYQKIKKQEWFWKLFLIHSKKILGLLQKKQPFSGQNYAFDSWAKHISK